MAELILTDEEKATEFWSALDPNSIGKVVIANAIKIEEMNKEKDMGLLMWNAALINLLYQQNKSNADTYTIGVTGLTYRNEPMGDFSLTLQRLPATPRWQNPYWTIRNWFMNHIVKDGKLRQFSVSANFHTGDTKLEINNREGTIEDLHNL